MTDAQRVSYEDDDGRGETDPDRRHHVSGFRRRRRLGRLILAATLLAASGGLYYYGFCNWSIRSSEWRRERGDAAIAKGLDYLYRTQAFEKSLVEGGEAPPHHLFLEHVLNRYEHLGLRQQMAAARLRNQSDWQWRIFFGMPGWPRDQLTAIDWAQIKHATGNSPDNYYAEWVLHALYPSRTSLRPHEQQRLLEEPALLRHDYHLTHALLAYVWLLQTDPLVAERYSVAEHLREVSERLYQSQTWAACTSDIYNERIAFFMYMEDGPPIKPRWIDRIILSQNDDGGWTYQKSAMRTVGQLVGYDGGGPSNPHATFLALYALSHAGD